MRVLGLLFVLAATLAVAGCASTRRTAAPGGSEINALNAGLRAATGQTLRAPSPDYIIDPPDVLSVTIKGNRDLDVPAITVGPDGKVSLALVGPILVAGRTVSDVAVDLEARYAKYIREAEVTVGVVEYLSKYVYVYGEVRKPGRYPYTGKDSVISALSQAGFLTRRASPNGIQVTRGNTADPEIYPVRLKDVVFDDDSRTNWFLDPEDIVYVPPTFLAKIGYTIEELVFPLALIVNPAATIDDINDDN